MQYVPKSKAQQFINPTVTSWEYEMQEAALNVAPISIRGRYPSEGLTSNTVSDTIVHVTSGTGVIGQRDGSLTELASGDQVHIAVEDAYYFEGDLDIIYAASPAWTPEQTQQLG